MRGSLRTKLSIFSLGANHLYVSIFQQQLNMKLMRFSRACDSYHDILNREFLLTGMAHPSGAPDFTPVLVGFTLFNILFSVKCFVDHCLSFCPYSLGLCVACPSYILRLLITHLVSSNFSYIVFYVI